MKQMDYDRMVELLDKLFREGGLPEDEAEELIRLEDSARPGTVSAAQESAAKKSDSE